MSGPIGAPHPAREHAARGFPGLLAAGAVPLVLLLLWQSLCWAGLFPEQVLVPASEVARALASMTANGELERHVGESLFRLSVGFAIGAFLGLIFGASIALSKLTEALFSPLFLALWQVPVIAFVPMLVMFLGIDDRFKIVVVAVSTFFPVALATFDAVRAIPKAWLEVARVYRTPLPALVRRILLPATLPPVLTGLRVAVTRAWIVLVAVELLAGDSGIGQMMEMGRQLFRIDVVLAGVVVSGVIGFALDRGAKAIQHRATRWRMA